MPQHSRPMPLAAAFVSIPWLLHDREALGSSISDATKGRPTACVDLPLPPPLLSWGGLQSRVALPAILAHQFTAAICFMMKSSVLCASSRCADVVD